MDTGYVDVFSLYLAVSSYEEKGGDPGGVRGREESIHLHRGWDQVEALSSGYWGAGLMMATRCQC